MKIDRKGALAAPTQGVCVGPIASHIDCFVKFLGEEGYARVTVKSKCSLVAGLSHWLKRRRVPLAQLDEGKLKQFYAHHRRSIRRGDVVTGQQFRGLIVHNETFSVPMTRIDSSAAQTIMANNDVKLRSQTATPGSEAALRRFLEGLRVRKPNYDEMAPWLAELIKEATPLNEPYVRWGALQSITFTHVDGFGGDEYIVRQEGGFSTWTIWLNSAGIIQDIDNYRMSD